MNQRLESEITSVLSKIPLVKNLSRRKFIGLFVLGLIKSRNRGGPLGLYYGKTWFYVKFLGQFGLNYLYHPKGNGNLRLIHSFIGAELPLSGNKR